MYRDYTSSSSRHYGDNAASLNIAGHPSDAATSSQCQPRATSSSSAASYATCPSACSQH
jgi:hypothetical protein